MPIAQPLRSKWFFAILIYMKKWLGLLLGVMFFSACEFYAHTNVTLPDGFVIHARVADTPAKTEKGLMFVKNLPADEGMLFVFDRADEHYFWMKNTLIDLDIIFLSTDGKITQLYPQVPHTYTYTPDAQVPVVRGHGQYVLEAAAGTIRKHSLHAGDKLTWTL